MSIQGANAKITETVLGWPGVTAHPHRFGGTEYRFEKREIGHIHGDSLVDIPFPTRVRDELVAAGAAEPHHVLPDSGWVSFYLRRPEAVGEAVVLLRRSYELALRQRQSRNTPVQPEPPSGDER
jgi:hypothetical protein